MRLPGQEKHFWVRDAFFLYKIQFLHASLNSSVTFSCVAGETASALHGTEEKTKQNSIPGCPE
jgi:hypothetical protein